MGGCSSSTATVVEHEQPTKLKTAASVPDLTIDSPAAKRKGSADRVVADVQRGPSPSDSPDDWRYDAATKTWIRKEATKDSPKPSIRSPAPRKISNGTSTTSGFQSEANKSIQLSVGDMDYDEHALALFSEANRNSIQSEEAYARRRESIQERLGYGQAITFKWKKGKLLGTGAFGRVYLGVNLESGALLAIKIIEIGVKQARVQRELLMVENEIRVLQSLEHPNIVRYIGTDRGSGDCDSMPSLNIFMEFVDGGSLSSAIANCKNGRLTEACTQAYSYQILMGLRYLHEKKIAHRDIKPANILLQLRPCGNCQYTLKIADFGASKMLGDLISATEGGMMTLTGTPHYMAPEVVLQTGHGRKADIWSLGCGVIEMLSGRPPWAQDSAMGVLFKIGTHDAPPPFPPVSAEGQAFLVECFTRSFRSRPSASTLMRMPWFADVRRYFPENEAREGRTRKRASKSTFKGTATVDQNMEVAPATARGEETTDAPSMPTLVPRSNDDARAIRPTPASVRDFFSKIVKEDPAISRQYAEDERLRHEMERFLLNPQDIDYNVDDNYT